MRGASGSLCWAAGADQRVRQRTEDELGTVAALGRVLAEFVDVAAGRGIATVADLAGEEEHRAAAGDPSGSSADSSASAVTEVAMSCAGTSGDVAVSRLGTSAMGTRYASLMEAYRSLPFGK